MAQRKGPNRDQTDIPARLDECKKMLIGSSDFDFAALISRMTPRNTGDNTTAMATIDRLLEMCKGVPLTGQSWRRK